MHYTCNGCVESKIAHKCFAAATKTVFTKLGVHSRVRYTTNPSSNNGLYEQTINISSSVRSLGRYTKGVNRDVGINPIRVSYSVYIKCFTSMKLSLLLVVVMPCIQLNKHVVW